MSEESGQNMHAIGPKTIATGPDLSIIWHIILTRFFKQSKNDLKCHIFNLSEKFKQKEILFD